VTDVEIWAAIDLQHGRVVSLRKGDPNESTVWTDDPLVIAECWERQQIDGLHIIDLDGALDMGSNRTTVESIIRKTNVPVQVGGGLRSETDVQRWLDLGADRVVLGTLVYNDPSILIQILNKYGPEKIVVATDYRNGMIVTKGWRNTEDLKITKAVSSLQATGIRFVLATAVELDGTARGPDISTLQEIRASTDMFVLASGGVRIIEDVRELQRARIDGVIIGRALYEGTIQLFELGRGVR
jgi:phosphoribosylformimino-5-aminoimidazole carboxamide ribotide isomerase